MWTSVELRMPDDDIDVLLYVPDCGEPVWIGHYDGESRVWRWCDGSTISHKVTHWMELPEGP